MSAAPLEIAAQVVRWQAGQHARTINELLLKRSDTPPEELLEELLGHTPLQVAAGVPVYETGRILELTDSQARCVVPTLQNSQRVLASIIQQSFELLSRPAADDGHHE